MINSTAWCGKYALFQSAHNLFYVTRFPALPTALGFGAPVHRSARSEIFVATRATPFPSPVGTN
jgi:hypothetical protein